ncbi:MAG TPA: S8/S53 family peptidase, partial [Stackebrandtia sp.]|uniref:S8 family peptidase n=1 Tax=Stackebrandtia sp. TaxID=2023065 RepID=UPI002D4FED39
YPQKFLNDPDCCGKEIDAGMTKGIRWAAEHGADVIVIPSGGSPGDKDMEEAVEYAIKKKNVPVVAAAGNKESGKYGNKTSVESPADLDSVVAVNGTGRDGKLWPGAISPTGVSDGSLSVSAPAEDIVSAKLGGGYNSGSGTSDACAITGGVVALMKAQWKDIGWQAVSWRLTQTADGETDKSGNKKYNLKLGYGVINPVKALTVNVKRPKGVPDDTVNPKPDPKTSPNSDAPANNKSSSKDKNALVASNSTTPWLPIALAAAAVVLLAALLFVWLRRRKSARPTTS